MVQSHSNCEWINLGMIDFRRNDHSDMLASRDGAKAYLGALLGRGDLASWNLLFLSAFTCLQ